MVLGCLENTTDVFGTEDIRKLKDRITFLERELEMARDQNKRLTIENEKLIIDNHFLDRKNK